ncbi:uncharacterized protein AB675_4661 [Cyphellophora attinorum]|uniref:Fibronectin type-III domain-containing protein n=1 Tax=Cyphellophora attinorum TaxID=1664694 RepID=A0A0N0NLF6_9EURO|nr:uncharacterized protein AB675_4661 [Phialophora attinorum]KPI38989.1 hypothetical protein AB675_4661 [Phialophora attinorum]
MPVLRSQWMDSLDWQRDSVDWVNYAYRGFIAPRLEVTGRMAMLVLAAVVWAFAWLLWRTYSVLHTPNDVLVDKLGLDIPPQPLVTLEEISSSEVQIGWKPSEASTAIQEYQVEINGKILDRTKKSETAAVISHLQPGRTYDIRVFSVSAGRFQTPSPALHVRLPPSSQPASEDGAAEALPTVRAIAARAPSLLAPAAPTMMRENSSGPAGRRGTTGRRASPSGTVEPKEEEDNENLAELSSRFTAVREEIEAVEKQVQEEKAEYEAQMRELEGKKEKLRQDLKKRDEESSDLRKQVHKAESQNRSLLNDKTKKERELKARENERRKKKEDVAKWEEQISTMAEEIAGIETQKAAIKRRNEANVREIQQNVEEKRKEVAALEEEAKEKTQQIKMLEEERQQLEIEDETEESREASRQEQEREAQRRNRLTELLGTNARLWADLQQASMYLNSTKDRLHYYESMRQHRTISFAPTPTPLNLEPQRQRSGRRPRQVGSYGSSASVSSPRGAFGSEPFPAAPQFATTKATSPTGFSNGYFGFSSALMMPNEQATTPGDELETTGSVPMSPHADALLPADLLGDNSDEDQDAIDEDVPLQPTAPTNGKSRGAPFPNIGSPLLRNDIEPARSPSGGSSSRQSFSSPRAEGFADPERKSIHSGKEKASDEEAPSNSRKFMYNLFNLNRQRGKTLADEPPTLGSLKPAQSQSFPRNFDDLDAPGQPRRRLSYGGTWAFPGSFLRGEKDSEPSRLASASRRAFPSLMGLGKSNDSDFTPRTNSFDPGMRGGSNSPRPSSIYSFDKMPPPGRDALHVWNTDRSLLRNSPLAPDWGSMHSFSRSHSRRPSIGYGGSTTNLSLMSPDDQIVEPIREPRPLQAPIGTRPTSQQKKEAATPRLNPAAPNFTSLFKKSKGEKIKIRDPRDLDAPTTTASKHSIASLSNTPTNDNNKPEKPTLMSRISRTASTKTYSSMKFGSWKDKSFLGSKSSKDTMPEGSEPGGEDGPNTGAANTSTDQLGSRSVESRDSLTPFGTGSGIINEETGSNKGGSSTPKDKDKSTRTSINWNFMRKSTKEKDAKKAKDKNMEATPSEVSVSEASVGGLTTDDDHDDGDGDDRR